MKRPSWDEPANIIAAASAVLALLSLVVSVRSCEVADRSYVLASAEYRSQRSVVLGGSLDSTGDAMVLKPQDPSTALQEATAFFPSEVNSQEWPVRPPDHRLYVVMLRAGLERFVAKTVPAKKGYVQISDHANVPVLIHSGFTAKGQSFGDLSMYRINYGFIVTDSAPPSIEVRGLLFVERLRGLVDARRYLDSIWDQGKRTDTTPRD